MAVRRYNFAHNEDLGDVRLEERATNRTEFQGEGKKQAHSIKHRNTSKHKKHKRHKGRKHKRR